MLIAAQLFITLITITILFQLALALGMPWGHLAMGGRYPGQFPPAMRVAAVVQILILAALGVIVAIRAGLVFPTWFPLSTRLIWVVVAFCGVSTVLNLITPSKWERIIWAPVNILLLISVLIIALQ